MAKGYLIDSNAVIDFLNGALPDGGKQLLTNLEPNISIVTRIEIFCSNKISEQEMRRLSKFVTFSRIFNVDESVVAYTIQLRLKYKTKLPDAIIAATAITNNLTLITRNTADFGKIDELDLINPYTL